jgi:hypothetical protein
MQPVKSHHYTELCLDLAFIVAHRVLCNTKASTRCQCFFVVFLFVRGWLQGGSAGLTG